MEKQFFLKKTKYMHDKQQAVPVKGLPVFCDVTGKVQKTACSQKCDMI